MNEFAARQTRERVGARPHANGGPSFGLCGSGAIDEPGNSPTLTIYPVCHSASGYAVSHPKTINLASGERGELCDRHWGSFSDASDRVPDVRYSHSVIDFWLDCFAIHRRFNRAVIRFATGF